MPTSPYSSLIYHTERKPALHSQVATPAAFLWLSKVTGWYCTYSVGYINLLGRTSR